MLVPAMLAVLLGEAGGVLARARHGWLALVSCALVLAVSTIGGTVIAPMLTPPARTLLVGVALLLAAAGQLRDAPVVRPELAIWSSSVPLSLFALSLYAGSPFAVAVGGALGLAAVIGIGARAARTAMHRTAAALLSVAGLFAALAGLRLL